MIQSMTGFGKCIKSFGTKNISITVKALNSKQQDLFLKMPSVYKDYELELRSIIGEKLLRGKIECFITLDETNKANSDVYDISSEALAYYMDNIEAFINSNNRENIVPQNPFWTDLLRLPGVMKAKQEEEEETSEEELNFLKETLNEALDELIKFRIQEGKMLEAVLSDNINNIILLSKEIERPEAERIKILRERIEESLAKVQVDYDRNRLEQEMIYYIEKIDINEEKTRLSNHLTYFMDTLSQENIGQGKTLGFIAQEIGREINTMGSKSNNAEMQQIVIKMKDHLEQIKEQILNIL